MLRRFGAVLTWLVAMAVPLQGLAMSALPLCLPSLDGSAASMAPPTGASTSPDAAAAARHDHGAGHGAGHGGGHGGDAGATECCSTVCSLAAVSLSGLSAGVAACSPAPVNLTPSLYRGVILDRIDRPPRLDLA